MLNVMTVQTGVLEENCYVVYDAGKCVIIDPGDQPDKIRRSLEALNLVPAAILLTHGHFDHIGAMNRLTREYPDIPVYAAEDEKYLLQNPELNGMGIKKAADPWVEHVAYLADGEEISLIGAKWRVIATPGHTKGSCCYYIKEAGLLFSGDTLFQGSCGRTDFPTGSMSDIVKSIREKLMALPDETLVLPGHAGSTSIGAEKKYNFIMRM